MDQNREEEWASRRADSDSLRNGLERATEGMDDPPEKISLDEKPYDRFGRQADIRDDLGKAVDVAFYNSAEREKRDEAHAAFDLISKKMQRRYGVDGVEGTNRLMTALSNLETNPESALRFLYQEYVEGSAAQTAHQTDLQNSIRDIEAVEKKYDVRPEVWNLLPDYMATPEFQRRKTGDNEKDILMAVRAISEGLKRVKM
jgi:hypothetical protein